MEQQYSGLVNRLQNDQVLETANRLRETVKRQKRKRCCASNRLPRVLTSRWLTGRSSDVITPPPALHIRMS
ncbi:hypothetical protein DMI62_00805 [Escherichia coli]|nr:hypothetical protein [Escherichia coli]